MKNIHFDYRLDDDGDGYELGITINGHSTLVDGSLTFNNALGDLIRATTSVATGQWRVDTWHGREPDLVRVRFSNVPVISSDPASSWGVRIEVHGARSVERVLDEPRLDSIVSTALELARAIYADTKPHVTTWWGDDLAHALLGRAIELMETEDRPNPWFAG